MRRVLGLAAATLIMSLGLPSMAQGDHKLVITSRSDCPTHPLRVANRISRHSYKHSGNRGLHPRTKHQKRRYRLAQRCASPKQRHAMRRYKSKKARSYRKWYRAKQASPSGGSWCAPASWQDPAGAGCWVIPAYIVSCESHGSWSAYNPSGAVGPYQLLGKGAPFPVSSREQAMEHHRIARALYAGGAGRSHWVC